MTLEPERKKRDYLYGRLLALAENLEEWALNEANQKRQTNAARLMQRFAERPYSTWRTLELALTPYKARLGGKAYSRQRMIDEVIASFDSNDFLSDKRLSGEFLLGYHCQREALRSSKNGNNETTDEKSILVIVHSYKENSIMETLKNKIDFAVIVCVHNANPNGDPLNGNRPRVDYEGYGELSDVCIKRKIRNRLMETGHSIFVQSDDRRTDDFRSLRARAEGMLSNIDTKDDKKYREAACQTWMDVRAFGQVFAYSGKGKGKGKKGKSGDESAEGDNESGVSIGIRGPVSSIRRFQKPPFLTGLRAFRSRRVSVEKVTAQNGHLTRMGMKHRVDHGVYVFYGSMNRSLLVLQDFRMKMPKRLKKR